MLGFSDDVIAAFDKKFGDQALLVSGSTSKKDILAAATESIDPVDNQVTELTNPDPLSASARLAKRQLAQQLKQLRDWIETQRQEPVIDAYFTAYCLKAQADAELEKKRSVAPDAVEVLTRLRHSAAVNAQRTH